jgi:hypothetical protein
MPMDFNRVRADSMIALRRFALVFALMFWQGGFMFYGAVTLPVVRELLGNMPERSLITQHVTQWMNLFGTLAILATFIDLYASPLPRKRWRLAAWLGMALPQPLLIFMHHEMSALMAARDFHISDMHQFMSYWHRPYVLLCTVQWLSGMIFTWQSLTAWRAEDRATSVT